MNRPESLDDLTNDQQKLRRWLHDVITGFVDYEDAVVVELLLKKVEDIAYDDGLSDGRNDDFMEQENRFPGTLATALEETDTWPFGPTEAE